MKTSETRGLQRAGIGAILALAMWNNIASADEIPNFKPGTYTGTLQVVQAIDANVFAKSTIKLRGHTTDPTRIIFLAPPNLAMPIRGQTPDDHPVRFFTIEKSTNEEKMIFIEWNYVDAGSGSFGGDFFTSLIAKPNSVTAEVALPDRTVGSFQGSHTVKQKLIIKLVRTGP